MRVVTHILRALAAFFMFAALALAPAAGAAMHDCCPEDAPTMMSGDMDGPCPHAAQMQQSGKHADHEKVKLSCGMACCAGLASSMALPTTPDIREVPAAHTQPHIQFSDIATSALQAIVTPPPRLLTHV